MFKWKIFNYDNGTSIPVAWTKGIDEFFYYYFYTEGRCLGSVVAGSELKMDARMKRVCCDGTDHESVQRFSWISWKPFHFLK